ncbi:1-deoxy-D-xylulose-5-phosphate reductoisomerase [Jannaschia donghaensis]|uniref:1-deoxy-D-xylulose 5-phosphate reductoisomerase n=1 Tax=Jannaschia donghaensis TaxID=420998 RepID=A0A0M6YLQ4_9RHOB|nr:1-deoxy-D-xylulose-5-phosphate reductoisomerase [Jannaschia donghaensis]CTQ50769.1 1-deoxy-D-xylulose 5-phosphate reductoisomerase [Jannaschia donghaensis]
MRRISIFGATGSIGQNTLDLLTPGSVKIVVLTGGANIARLAEDAIRFGADLAVTAFDDRLADLRAALAGSGVEAAAGQGALADAADCPADWIMSAIVGSAGLVPSLRAARHGTTLALANKESLVCAGPLLLAEAHRHGTTILPVDSEHSAVFQALVGEDMRAVEKVIITGSGGGLRDVPLDRLHDATPEQAGTHPNWDMGARITVDSASMFNKGMELIETKEFFGLPASKIDTVIHPQSLIHALVQFDDGALMAHLGAPDMRHAIGYALNWPDRAHVPVARLDLAEVARLDFHAPDPARYPALAIARGVMERGGLSGAVFNAAKEAALDLFLDRDIRFTDMAPLVERTLEGMYATGCLDAATLNLDMVLQTDRQARDVARDIAPTL